MSVVAAGDAGAGEAASARAGGAEGGLRLAETVEERRARLGVPRPPRSRGRRRLVVAALICPILVVGMWFGYLPGSLALGRYPMGELRALADRINSTPVDPACNSGSSHVIPATVDAWRGRVDVHGRPVLGLVTPEEAAMIEGPVHAAVCSGPSGP